jgi:CheY-like chemotaxis protein
MEGKRILISDDDPGVLEVLVRKLRQNDYEVMGFHEKKDVIEKCKICDSDPILLDIVMPDVDRYTSVLP